MMNIYEKLQKCKADLQAADLKKTGSNTYAKYAYWDLSDFQPTVVSLFQKIGLCSFFSFNTEYVTLTIVNTENSSETIVMTSPMAAADLKGCHQIQNMGAVETYQRRYLYMAALDISEPDALDLTKGKEEALPKAKVQQIKAEPANDAEPKEYKCESCGLLFKSFTHNGKDYTAAQAYHASMGKNGGKALCRECGKKSAGA
jgi:hypothetical protein